MLLSDREAQFVPRGLKFLVFLEFTCEIGRRGDRSLVRIMLERDHNVVTRFYTGRVAKSLRNSQHIRPTHPTDRAAVLSAVNFGFYRDPLRTPDLFYVERDGDTRRVELLMLLE